MLNHLDNYSAAIAVYNSTTADHNLALAAQLDAAAKDLLAVADSRPERTVNGFGPEYVAQLREHAAYASFAARSIRFHLG